MTGILGSQQSELGVFILGSADENPTPPPSGSGFVDQLEIGTKQSLSVTAQPTIGGRWSWLVPTVFPPPVLT